MAFISVAESFITFCFVSMLVSKLKLCLIYGHAILFQFISLKLRISLIFNCGLIPSNSLLINEKIVLTLFSLLVISSKASITITKLSISLKIFCMVICFNSKPVKMSALQKSILLLLSKDLIQ